MSYIEQKLAAAFRLHVRQETVHKVWCSCGEWEGRTGHAAHVAAATVKELGLVQFYSVDYGGGEMAELSWEHYDEARDHAAEGIGDDLGDSKIVTGWFTGWEPAENVVKLP